MSVCRFCGAVIDWMPTEDGNFVPVDPEPVLVVEGEGDEHFYSEEDGILVGRQAKFAEESPEMPVGFVRHR